MSELFIEGHGSRPLGGAVREIRCPADGSLVATVAEAGAEDTEAAIAAARAGLRRRPVAAAPLRWSAAPCCTGWPTCSSATRTRSRGWSRSTPASASSSREYDVDDIVGVFRHFAGLAAADAGRVVDTGTPDVVSRVVHEPVGVCSLITPWNYPLLQTAWKVAPASRPATPSCSSRAS